MDVNDLRIAVTVAGLLLFLALVVWAWSRNREADFADAAQLPFLDDEPGAAAPRNPNETEHARGGAR